jgi:hypothetical protein
MAITHQRTDEHLHIGLMLDKQRQKLGVISHFDKNTRGSGKNARRSLPTFATSRNADQIGQKNGHFSDSPPGSPQNP